MYYVYILRCLDGSLYTGIAKDAERRLQEHLSKDKKGAKYTKSKTAVGMECIFQTENRVLAAKLEYRIKQLTRAQKEKVIKDAKLDVLQDKIDVGKYTYYGKKMP